MAQPRAFAAALVRAWRSLKRTPGFFTIGVASLAIALGLATTVIAQIDALMHPVAALHKPEELYRVDMRGMTKTQPAVGEIAALLRTSSAVSGVVSAEVLSREWVEAGTHATMSTALAAPREFFELLGARVRLGRLFDPSETTQSGVAIVSDEFWRQHFNNRASLDSATLEYGGANYRIVGVLLPRTSIVVWAGGIWLPKPHTVFTRLEATIVRLKPGVSTVAAAAAFQTVADDLARRYGVYVRHPSFDLYSLAPNPLGLGEFHRALMGAAAFILLIACANVSALMLARAVARRRDHALRLALGATRMDLIRDVAAEITVLAAIGGLAGVLIAQWTMQLMVSATPVELSWLGFQEPRWSLRVFVATCSVVAIAIGIAAIVPALDVTRVAPADPLKEGSAALTGRPSRRFHVLIIGELALAMVMLFGASLITKTAGRVSTYDFGYEARGLTRVSAEVSVVPELDALRRRLQRRSVPADMVSRISFLEYGQLDGIAQRIRALPEVRSAAWTMDFSLIDGVIASDASQMVDSLLYMPETIAVGAGFFETLGIPIIEGRDFVAADLEGAGSVILDELSARRLFPAGDPLSGRVRLGRAHQLTEWLPVIGVVRNVRLKLPEDPAMEPEPVVFLTKPRANGFAVSFVVRPRRGVSDVAPAALRAVADQLPPRTPVSVGKWLRQYDTMVRGRRFVSGIFITLSAASLILATAGLFGVLSYAARQRNREFAVRIALGAQRKHVMRLVFRDGIVMALGGTAIGAFAGMWGGFVVYEWLWGVYPVDPTALIAAEIVLIGITMLASAVPASAAARANPVDVMRST